MANPGDPGGEQGDLVTMGKLIAQAMVRGFKGENRLLPDDLLPPTVSPDAQNCDYSRGTIKKRPGYAKLHTQAMIQGGLSIINNNGNNCVWIPNLSAYYPTGAFTFEFFIRINKWGATAYSDIITCRGGTSSGWEITIKKSAKQIILLFYDGGGTLRVLYSPAALELGKVHHVVVRRNSSDSIKITLDGVDGGATTYTGVISNTRPLYVGGGDGTTPSNTYNNFVIDEIRFWKDERTDAEITAARYRELNSSELADPNLIGYWRFNECRGNICEDLSINKNHGCFYDTGPMPVRGLVPEQSQDGYALRFDGCDDHALGPYRADYAPILDTGNTWTVEAWVRLDNPNHYTTVTVFHLGSTTAGTGPPFWLYIAGSGHDLKYKYSTTTTHSRVEVDTTYDVVVGVPFHVAMVRDGDSIYTYINGELVDTETGCTAENGPTTSTLYGMFFGAESRVGTFQASTYAPVTLDEARLWTSVRSQVEIQEWRDGEFVDCKVSDLVGCWRFNAADNHFDETGNSYLKLKGDDARYPSWAHGLVYSQEPPRLLMCAPLAAPKANEVESALVPFHKELLVFTNTTLWSVLGDRARRITDVSTYFPEPSPYDWCHYKDALIFTNGFRMGAYRGNEKFAAIGIFPPVKACTATPHGGSGWPRADGDYSYVYAFRNKKDGSESLYGPVATASMATASHDTCVLSAFGSARGWGPDLVRIYRKDPGSTVYHYLGDMDDVSGATFTDTGADITNNEALNEHRGRPLPHRYCAVYGNRLWFLNQGVETNRQIKTVTGATNAAPIVITAVSHGFLTGDTVRIHGTLGNIAAYGQWRIQRLTDDTFSLDGSTGNGAYSSGGIAWRKDTAHPSRLSYSEANSGSDFLSSNYIDVDPSDGDEGTGVIAAFGGLVVFKQYSIHFLTGEGGSTYSVRKIVAGQGCVSAGTISESPFGIYFLSHDGVYVLTPDLRAAPVSLSQQNLFLSMDPDKYRWATGVYDPIRHLYILSVDTAERGPGSYYAEQPGLYSNYYTFASGGGDATGNADLTELGIQHLQESQRGDCALYDSSDEAYGTIGEHADPTSAFTVGLWVKASSFPAGSTKGQLVSYYNASEIYWRIGTKGSTLRGGYRDDSGENEISASELNADTWYHLVLVKSASRLSIYRDGELDTTAVFTTNMKTPTGNQVFRTSGAFGGSYARIGGYYQNVFYLANTALEPWQVKEIYEYEAQGMHLWAERVTMVYDEESKSWAKWDCSFDALCVAEHLTNRAEVLGAVNGFVYRLFDGESDGSKTASGGALPSSGSVTSNATATITDANAVFPTEGDGLVGCRVLVASSTDSTEQVRRIIANTATSLYLDKPFSPAITGTYYIAPIDWYWESPWMDLGDPSIQKRLLHFFAWQTENADAETVTFQFKTDYNETWTSDSFTTADEFVRLLTVTRGRKVKVRFSNRFPNQQAEITSFQQIYEPKRWN